MEQTSRWPQSSDSNLMSSDCDVSLLWELEDLYREAGVADLPATDAGNTEYLSPSFGSQHSMPIPVMGSRRMDVFMPEMMDSAVVSPEMGLEMGGACGGVALSPSFWDRSCMEMDSLAIQDPLLQVGKDPTLAELNSGMDPLLDYVEELDIQNDTTLSGLGSSEYDQDSRTRWGQPRDIPRPQGSDLFGPSSFSSFCAREQALSSSLPPVATLLSHNVGGYNFPSQVTSVQEDAPQKIEAKPSPSTLQQLLSREPQPVSMTRLSASAPSQMSFEQHWLEAHKAVAGPSSVCSPLPARVHSSVSVSSVSSGDALSTFDENEFSHDEGFDSELDDSDREDFSDDSGDDASSQLGSPSPSSSKAERKERYFWQYNVQAKGPKGQRLTLQPSDVDPHHLNAVMDPVFSPACHIQGIKHSGKARRGDGNDLTPSPRRLFQIGQELKRLNRLINELSTVNEAAFASRPRSRKEKNKLASRACRLKKKAQHEANKLKLYGLEYEHKYVLHSLAHVKSYIAERVHVGDKNFSSNFEKIVEENNGNLEVAGNAAEFVNKVLVKVSEGRPSGGLEDLA